MVGGSIGLYQFNVTIPVVAAVPNNQNLSIVIGQ
jgi:hypothetical protein